MIAIIPTYNNPTDLAVLLVQLQQQTVLPTSIFLADNSPSGYGLELVKRHQWAVPIYVHPNAGTIYQSWNKGIQFAEGDDVVILNDDLLIPQDFIYRLERAFNDDYFCLCPASPGFPPVGKVREGYTWSSRIDQRKRQSYTNNTRLIHRYVPLLTGWCFALHRDLVDNIGEFDESFQIWYGDTDYSKRLTDAGFKHTFINQLFVQHYGTSSYSKIDTKVFNKTNYQDQVKYEQKHGIKHENLGWDQYA